MTKVNVCIECKWCTKDSPKTSAAEYDVPLCTNPDCNEPNLIFGGTTITECVKQRYKEDGKCGKEGKYWEAR